MGAIRAKRRTISIHAPRTGSDAGRCPSSLQSADFNPRSPHGERRRAMICRASARKFQSTLPARGATGAFNRWAASWSYFNPRSPHGERPVRHTPGSALLSDFNPRSPHGERLAPPSTISATLSFQSTLPARGATGCSTTKSRGLLFQSTLPARGATSHQGEDFRCVLISIHAPRTGSDYYVKDYRYLRIISIHAPRTGSDAKFLRSAGV